MRQSSESDRFVLCSERIVLGCKKCGERVVLLGFEEDWRSEGRTTFECECGEKLTLADRLEEETTSFKALLRRFRTSLINENL